MKAYERMEVEFHSFLTSTLGGDKWSASGLGRFTPEEKSPIYSLGGT
jgi:hypothetical protein